MSIGTDYYDAMDRDRCIVPEKDLGTHYLCGVYWRDAGFGGKVQLSKKLFGNRYFGFVEKADLEKQ